jgi:hypothetical protein
MSMVHEDVGEFSKALQEAVWQECHQVEKRKEGRRKMVTEIEEQSTNGKAVVKRPEAAKSLKFAQRGIRSGEDFANTMSALMSDLLEGNITPDVGNAVCNAGGKLLKMVEMQYKYASPPAVVKDRPNIALAELDTPASE